MSTASAQDSKTGWMIARAISLLLAVGIGVLLWSIWEKDFRKLWAGSEPALPVLTNARMDAEPAKPVNEALQKCLDKRVGDVDRMKADGVINDAQYAQFKSRAEELCQVQNPA